MVLFQIVSDLHIEYKNDYTPNPLTLITPCAKYLILAGDIGSLYKLNQLTEFLKLLCVHFKAVIYVPGNHEYYTIKNDYIPLVKLKLLFQNIEKNIENLYILDRKSVEIENIIIVGCTLWSYPTIKVPKFIVRIREMNTYNYKKHHLEDLKYIKNIIRYNKKNDNKKLMVVTHHCPTFSIIPKHKINNKYISLYTSNIDYLLDKNIVNTWVCGHIHSNFNIYSKKGTLIIGNQLGKPKDKINDYNKKMTINI